MHFAHRIAEEVVVALRIAATEEGYLFARQVHLFHIIVQNLIPGGARTLHIRVRIPA